MHQCLSIAEMQRVIFCEVYRQHKALLDSFVYLIQCLPRDLWKIVRTRMTFWRPMSRRDWEVFFRYSSRIQELSSSVGFNFPTRCLDFGDNVILALSTPPSYGPLIPYLRRLHWDKPNRKHASLLRLLLTPSLVSLSLSSCALRSPEVSILTSIGTVCPSLKSLHIAMHKPSASHLDARGEKILSEALPYLHSLESLICPALDETAIIHLSHPSSLIELSLELQFDLRLEKIKPFVAAPAFASFQPLTLRASTLPTLTSLLEPMRFWPRSVAFVVASACTPDALHLFFLTLVSACGSEQLSQISLTTSTERQRGIPHQQVSLSTFQPLFGLPNIDLFEFDAPYNMVLDDDTITALAKNWPKLTSISINRRSGWGITSRVTPKGLITLLSCWAALTNFALAVGLSGIDVYHLGPPEARPGNGATNDKCRAANFVTPTIEYPITVAAFLSDICPELETVESAWDNTTLATNVGSDNVDSYVERWDEVGELLPAFSTMGKQCMEWARKRAEEGGLTPA